jgi:hypothetical protein
LSVRRVSVPPTIGCVTQVDWDKGKDGKKYDNAAYKIDTDAFLGDAKATRMLSSYLLDAVNVEANEAKRTAIRAYAVWPARVARLCNGHAVVCRVYDYVLKQTGS